jgi:hypothetical protein
MNFFKQNLKNCESWIQAILVNMNQFKNLVPDSQGSMAVFDKSLGNFLL